MVPPVDLQPAASRTPLTTRDTAPVSSTSRCSSATPKPFFVNLWELTVDAGVMVAFAFCYLMTVVAAFVLYSPIIVLFVVLLLAAGVLRLLVWPLQLLIRKLRRHSKEQHRDETWLFS